MEYKEPSPSTRASDSLLNHFVRGFRAVVYQRAHPSLSVIQFTAVRTFRAHLSQTS
jgi:hypothetical protein